MRFHRRESGANRQLVLPPFQRDEQEIGDLAQAISKHERSRHQDPENTADIADGRLVVRDAGLGPEGIFNSLKTRAVWERERGV